MLSPQSPPFHNSPEHGPSVTQDLEQATKLFYEISNVVDLELEEQGIDLDHVSPSHYWMRVAEVGNTLAKDTLATPDSIGIAASLELTAAVPNYLLAQQRLSSREHPSSSHLKREKQNEDRYYASYFNGLVRGFAWSHPSVTAVELNRHMANVLKKSGITQHPERMQHLIADCIRGAQHETAAGAALQLCGQVRLSDQVEDLKGIDYVVALSGAEKAIPIDIKTSRLTIGEASHGQRYDYAVTGGRLMLHSGFEDEDLNGYFFASERANERISRVYRPALISAANDPRVRNVVF